MKKSLSMKVLYLFKAQLERAINTKVVIAPTPIEEKGLIIKLSLFKAVKSSNLKNSGDVIKLRLAVEGFAESHTGLDQALSVIEKIEHIFKTPIHLELKKDELIPNTRITQIRSEDDSLLDNPDSTAVQEVLDERIILIYLNKQAREVLNGTND